MNFIDTIEIKNFKSIRHQKIEGCKRVNVFIGYPNVGKSNILEALSVFQYCKIKYPADFKAYCRYEDMSNIFFEGNVKESVFVSYNNLEKIDIKYESETALSFSVLKNSNNEKSNWSHTSFPEINVLKYQFLLNSPYKDVVTLKHLQSPHGQNLFGIIASNLELRKFFNELLKSYNLKLLVDRTSNSLRLIREIGEDTIFQLSYILIADTLQRLIFHKAAIATNENTVLLFEEPEAHMFPPYISKLTGDIIYDENKNQFFIATHSPYVLNDFISDLDIEELSLFIVTYDKEKGETLIHRMSDSEVHEAYQFGYDFFTNINQFIQQKEHE
jgi:AAA15 family ATPase/GTPase